MSNSDPERGNGSPSASSAEAPATAPEGQPPQAAPPKAGPSKADAQRPVQEKLPHVDTTPTGRAQPKPEPEEEEDPDVYRVKLDVFEGPLDLLLHLIRKHELDILDIPVGFITEKYLEYMKMMQHLQIDVASEYLVMAATLTHIKSKMLLPPDPSDEAEEEEEEEIDPRAELVRQLLEYQKYRHAASQLELRATLGRDAFPRGDEEPMPEGPAPLAPINVFKLFDAFERVLKRAAKDTDHQIMFERVNIADRIVQLTELLTKKRRLPFEELFIIPLEDEDGHEEGDEGQGPRIPTRLEMVITFLAILEMGKMRVVRIVQEDTLGPILVEMPAKTLDERDDAPLDWSTLRDSPPETPSAPEPSPPEAPSAPEPSPPEAPSAPEPSPPEAQSVPEPSPPEAQSVPEPSPSEAPPSEEADETP